MRIRRVVFLASALWLAGCSLIVGDDGGGSDIDAGTGPCGTVDVLRGDLEQADIDALWITTGDAFIAPPAVGGAVVFPYDVSGGNAGQAEMRSRRAYGLAGEGISLAMQWAGDGTPDPAVTPYLELRGPAGETFAEPRLGIEVYDPDGVGSLPMIVAVYQSPGSQVYSETYDPARHRFWRVRQDGDALEIETSATGMAADYGRLHRVADPQVSLSLSHVAFGIARYPDQNTPVDGASTVTFSDIGGSSAELASTCRVDDLTTDFAGAAPDARWYEHGFDCIRDPGPDGYSISGSSGSFCGLTSATAYDVRGADLWFDFGQLPGGVGSSTFLTLDYDTGQRFVELVREVQESTSYRIDVYTDGFIPTNTASLAEAPGPVRFWRLREDGGEVLFSVYDAAAEPLSPEQGIRVDNILDLSHLALRISLETPPEGSAMRIDSIGPAPSGFAP